MPEQEAVVVITAGVMEMGGILNLVWTHLLPGMSDKIDSDHHSDLERKLVSLSYAPPVNRGTSVDAPKWSGRRFGAHSNDAGIASFSFNFSDEKSHFTFQDSEGRHQFEIGNGEWIESHVSLMGHQVKVAVSGTWHKRNQFEMTVRLLGTPFCDVWTCDFLNDAVREMYRVTFGRFRACRIWHCFLD